MAGERHEQPADIARHFRRGMSPYLATAIFVLAVAVFVYFAALKAKPFSHPFVLHGIFHSANDMPVEFSK